MKEDDQNKICFISLYVDDCLVAGDQKLIDNLVETLQNLFKMKVYDGIHDLWDVKLISIWL